MVILLTVLFGFHQFTPSCQPNCTVQAASATSLILVDGVLDEEDWQQAVPAMRFHQMTPDEGQLTEFKTEVQILHDAKILYVGVTLYDTEPHRIRRTLGQRDQFNHADWFSIALDVNNDQQTAFNFAVNAAGVRVEGFQVDGTAPSEAATADIFGEELFQFNPDWDAEWAAEARVDSIGWTVEMAIPISLLRITSVHERSWGINFRRWVARAAELSEWALVPVRERNGGTVSRFGTLYLAQTVRPTVHRYGHMHTFVPNYRTEGDDQSMTVPIPGVGGGLALGRSILLQATVVPEFYPETIHEHINKFSVPSVNAIRYDRFFPSSRQLIASIPSGSNLLFDHLGGISCAELLLGGASLHGRLPGRVTVAGIGRAYLPQSISDFPIGFTGRIQKDIGAESRIGISGTMEPVNPESNQNINSFEGILSAASMDWDLRNSSNSARWAGQMGLSQIKDRDYCKDEILDTLPDQNQLPAKVRDGLVARIEYGQLGKSFNWFTRVNVTQPDLAIPSIGDQLLPDRIEVTTGFRHARVKGTGIVKKGQFSLAVSQRLQYSNLTPKETILTGESAVLTPKHNRILFAIRAGIRSSGHLRLGANASVSTDLRRRFVLTPSAGHTWMQNELQISHMSMSVKGILRDRFTFDIQITATHASGNMDSPTWLVEFLASNPSLSIQRDNRHPLVQCHSVFGVDAIRATSSNCIRAHTYVSIGLFRTLDFEIGAHALGIGTTDHLNRQVVTDGHTGLVGQLRWEFKPGAVLRLGANVGRNISVGSSPDWEHILDLLTTPVDGSNYHLFSLSIARRWQR